MPRMHPFMLAATLLAVTPFHAALAQATLGSIAGRVTDQSGAPVPGVPVLLTNLATAQRKTSPSSADGYYQFPSLPPGSYTLRAEFSGFQTAVTQELVLQVGQALTQDLQLSVGEVSTTTEVKATAPLVQRESSALGQAITSQQVLEMPLNGRNFLSLTLLVPGATENPGAQSQFSINGQRGNQTSMLFDGLDSRMVQNGRPAVTPSVDAIQEFRIDQNSLSAVYGSGTAVINAALRSGTNQLHGVLWEFLRNNSLDARGYFDTVKPSLRRNQFGFTLGGPIRRNRTFFFVNYEGGRKRQSSTRLALIPTPAELAGNFSAGQPIYDPLTLNGNVRQQFPGNLIPANRLSQFAKAGAALYPLPNLTSVSGSNYAGSVPSPEDADQVHVRLDHQFSAKTTMFGRFSRTNSNALGYSVPLPYSGTTTVNGGLQALVNVSHIFTPSLLNSLTMGYTYGNSVSKILLADRPIAIQDFGLANLKITGDAQGMPLLAIAGYAAMGSPINNPTGGRQDYYQVTNDLTWLHNRHDLKIGVDLRQFRPGMYDQQTPNGNLMFDGRYTTQPGVARTGSGVADFVLGNPFSAQVTQLIDSNGIATLRWTRSSFYIQDNFKLTPKLMLNFGLRYEYDTPYRFVYNDAYVWSRSAGRFLIPGKDIPRLYNPDPNNFAPRLGFAYSVTPKTVIRGGGGVFYGFIRGLELQNAHANPPFLVNSTVNSAALTYTLPPGVFNPASRDVTPTTNLFSADPNYKTNYTYEWNLTVQRELGRSISLQAAYVGSSSHKLIGRSLINQATLDPNPAAPTSIQSRRPFAGAGDISITQSIDNANYHALQVTGEKRLSAGWTFLAAYTYAKALGISEGGDQSSIGNQYVSRKTYYGPTPYSQPQRFTLSTNYELPFGKGKPYANALRPVADKLIGGWAVSVIGIFFQGEFLTPTSNVSANVGRVDRNVPNCIANPNLDAGQRSLGRWFNTAAIVGQPFGTFGNCGTGIIQVAGTNNLDFALLKNIYFGDGGRRLQFRAEAFNGLNHPSFGAPGLTVGSSAFGAISSTRTTMRNLQLGLKFYW